MRFVRCMTTSKAVPTDILDFGARAVVMLARAPNRP